MKFFIMVRCYLDEKPYGIFPWSVFPVISKSNPIWLMIHLASSLLVITLSFLIIVSNKKFLIRMLKYSHWIFTIFILGNITNFGQEGKIIAIIANGLPLLIANIAFRFIGKWKYALFIYFLSITSPVCFEFFLFLKTYISLFYHVLFEPHILY